MITRRVSPPGLSLTFHSSAPVLTEMIYMGPAYLLSCKAKYSLLRVVHSAAGQVTVIVLKAGGIKPFIFFKTFPL